VTFLFLYYRGRRKKPALPCHEPVYRRNRRDSEKWPTRDRRKDPDKKDIINFTLYNPFTAGRMVKAVKILGELAEKALKTQDNVSYQGINIPRLLLKTTASIMRWP